MIDQERKDLVAYIFKKYNVENYEVKSLDECKVKSRKDSWCNYDKDKGVTLYLRLNQVPKELENAEERVKQAYTLLITAHEAGHGIQYSKGEINHKELLEKEKYRNRLYGCCGFLTYFDLLVFQLGIYWTNFFDFYTLIYFGLQANVQLYSDLF